MKTLVVTSDGDPLFVRDENGHDYEVGVHWATDARFRNWAKGPETKWDELWDKVYTEHPPLVIDESFKLVNVLASRRKVKCDLHDDPLLVKPAFRVLAANYLPPLAERDEQTRRARALGRLGGNPPEDEIVARRDEAHGRRRDQEHAKARPSHPSVWLSDKDLFSGIDTFVPGPMFPFATQSKQVFFEISMVHGLIYGGPAAPSKISPEFETLDETHVRRQEAMKRLQDPPVPDVDLVRAYMDGLWKRPVL